VNACPLCHCRHAYPVPSEDGRKRLECRHCGTLWIPRPVATYAETLCPECSSPDTIVTSTRKPTRFHLCRACGARFKSTEGSR
jgi:Zn ribbon nucleic-acid-binding protein